MSARDWFLLLLLVAHALAATIWLGGGVYYLVMLRPVVRANPDGARAVGAQAQRAFGEWAQAATITMVTTGMVLAFDRLAAGRGGLIYAALLAAKVVAAVLAFWLAGIRPARRARRRTRRWATTELIFALGLFAFIVGIALSNVYGGGAVQ